MVSLLKRYIKKKTYQGYNMISELNFPSKNASLIYHDLIQQGNPAQKQCPLFFQFLDYLPTGSTWEGNWLIKNVSK